MKREEAWETLSRTSIAKSEVERLFCVKEGKSLKQLYDVQFNAPMSLYHIIDTKKEIGDRILTNATQFGGITTYNSLILEEVEVELVHEKENEREIHEIPLAEPAPHSLHTHIISLITTGTIPPKTTAILPVAYALSHTSLKLPEGTHQAFSHIRVTQDFCNTIILDSTSRLGTMDHFLRPVEWVLSTTSPLALIIILSPYEVNSLLPLIKESRYVRLHLFAPRITRAMRSFESLDRFVAAAQHPVDPLPRPIALQLNLFSGSLYILNHAAYIDLCRILRLHFDQLPANLANRSTITSGGFVRSLAARPHLGITCPGFRDDPTEMLRKFLMLRRYGQNLGPSHMGKILHGMKLHKGKGRDFDETGA